MTRIFNLKTVLLVALCALVGHRAAAQASAYLFSQSSGTYSAITGGTVLSSGASMDDATFLVTIPSFTYNGTAYTQVYVSENGYVSFGNTDPGTSTRSFLSTSGGITTGGISAYSRDLGGQSTTSELRWQTVSGTTIFQWTNMANYFSTSQDMSFQIRLTPANNTLSVVYGSMSASASTTGQVGLRTTTSDFNNRTTSTSWSATTAGTSNTDAITLSSTVTPTSGLTFTWTPGTCFAPSGVAATAVTTTTATLGYTAPSPAPSSGYQYEVRTSGAAGSGATGLAASGSPAAGVTSVSITGLTSATTYTVYVRGNCGSGNFSNWSPAYTFTTLCNTFTAPFTENFNGASTPNCWTNTTTPESWLFNQSGTTGSPNPDYDADNISDHTGNSGYFAWVDGSGTGTNTGITLTSPPINIASLTSPRLRFFVFSQNTNTVGNNRLRIEVLDNGVWVLKDSVKGNLGTTWFEKSVSLAGLTSTVIQLRFVVDELGGNPAGFSAFYNDILIDDVTVEQTPSCLNPTLVTSSNVTNTGATISWTAPSPAPSSGYQYEVRTSGAAGSGATGLAASGSTAAGVVTASVTGLTATMTYTVYVRGNCGASGFSIWAPAATFTTACNPTTTLPWSDGFESLTSVGNTTFPSCWKKQNGDWASGDANTTFGTNAPRTGTKYAVDFYTATNEWLWTPTFQLTAGTSYDFSFWWAGDGYSGWTGEVGRNTTQDSTGATIMGAPFVTSSTTTSNTYQLVTRTFVPATTGAYAFGIRINATSSPYVLGFDDFSLSVTPSCPSPTTVTFTNVTNNSATLNWTAPGSAPSSGYQYEVRSSGAAGSGATGLVASGSTAAGVTTASVTGLTATTSYTVYVRSNCGSGGFGPWSSGNTLTTGLDCSLATATTCGANQTFSLTGTGAYNPVQVTTGNAPYGTPGVEKLYTFTATTTGTYTLNVTAATGGYVDYFFKPVSGTCSNTGWTFIKDVNAVNTGTFTLTGGTSYYILADPEGTGAMSQTFSIVCPATCATPTTLTASSITTTSASLGWTQPAPGTPSQWQISYGTGAATAASGTKVFTSANPYSLTGLTPATAYTFYVRAVCGPNDTSTWSPGTSFTTQCLPSTLPFAEDFNTFLPSCWSQATGYLSVTPQALTTVSSNAWNGKVYLNNAANSNAARINLYTTGKRDWIISPTIDLGSTVGNYVLEFNLGIIAYNGGTSVTNPVGTTLGSDDTVAVAVSTNNGATWSSVNALRTWTAANTPISATGSQRLFIPMNGYSGQIKIGFYASEGPVDDPQDNDIFVDSVRMTTCVKPVVNLGNDTTLCTGATLTLNGGTSATAFQFTNNSGTVVSTTSTYAVTAPGTYFVQGSTSNPGCFSRDTIVVTGAALPVVNLGNDTTICAGNSVTFNAGNAGASYLWSTSATTQTVSASTAGSYSVRVTSTAGCIGRDTVVLTVNPKPVVNLGNDTAFCIGNSLTLNAGNTGSSFLWSTGATTQTVSVSTSGSYNVRVTNTNGCIGRDTVVVTVNPLPVVNLGADTAFCAPATFTLDAGNAGSKYQWSTGDTTQSINVSTSGNYGVKVTTAGGCIGNDTVNVVVNPLPTAGTITVTGQSPTYTFAATGTANTLALLWNFGDGDTSTSTTPTHTYTTDGTYTVTFYVGNLCGIDSVSTTVTVTGTGVGSVALGNEVRLFPNPATNTVFVENASSQRMNTITVLNAVGAVVLEKHNASNKREALDLSTLAPGSYLVRIQLDGGTVVRRMQVVK